MPGYNYLAVPPPEDEYDADARHGVYMGALLLDRKVPDWWKAIDVDYLNVAHSDRCVLGQMYGSYAYGVETLGLTLAQATRHGFWAEGSHAVDADPAEMAERYGNLTDEWRRLIAARQGAAA